MICVRYPHCKRFWRLLFKSYTLGLQRSGCNPGCKYPGCNPVCYTTVVVVSTRKPWLHNPGCNYYVILQVEAAVRAAEQNAGPVDLLVTCAGVYRDTGEPHGIKPLLRMWVHWQNTGSTAPMLSLALSDMY